MRRLFLYVPAITGSRLLWEGLKARLETEPECEGDTFLSWPAHGRHLGKYTRGRTLEGYAGNLSAHLAELDAAATARDSPYDEIILFGSSLGALVVRWAWLDGCGAFSGDAPRPWAAKVTRIVLMAGINRGFSTRWESGRRGPRLLAEKVVISLASPFGFAWKDALAGAPFVTDLRLTWMRHLAEHPDRQPFVVQFLGTSDRLVRREDSRDIEQFPRAAHVEVADAAHFDVLDVAGPDRDNRYLLLRSYILGAPDPTTPPPVKREATEVVFVVHGIRAGVHGWVREVRQLVEDTGTQWRVVTPSYRYFSALAFAFPVTRRRKVRWFLDQYSGEVAQHPTANFHFVGHSNGTYLLGRALQTVPAVRFRRVYLAGSVLPATFPWHTYLRDVRRAPRIGQIRSDRGNRDIPVALLAQGLRGLRMHDVGNGGFGGFAELDAPPAIQWPFFSGGHGAPLATPERRRNVAAYITTGLADRPDGLVDSDGGLLGRMSRLSPVLLLVLTGLAVVVLAAAVVAPSTTSVTAALAIVAVVVALAFV
ncbi:hypothetical protein ACFO1B_18655 [Dactylosporangium siamense]|uniref:Alpha/beta hydrolase n=1 Tax=Dactylosporangium siamense TaxID=685454 RepID=A0A919PKM5_9ACTN|nr:hypothetical protein [Dactylosporangium siamense]GIG43898.1 hypothetical protein Dsi01nite_019390 [Dactylosporangium siamense]